MLERMWRKETLLYCWWEHKLIQPLWRIVWRFLKKTRNKTTIQTTIQPSTYIPLLGIYPEETIIEKDTCTPMCIAALFTTTSTWKEPRCWSTGEWITSHCIYIYNGILLSHKKEQIWISWTEVDKARACYTQWRKSEKEKQIAYINTNIWNL